jgi:hypothetical protein
VTRVGELEAHWALRSKRPGDSDDYRVLAFSQGPFQSGDFGRFISRYLPGTPSGPGQHQPDALPWVTFSASQHGGASYAGLAILEWSDQLDRSGRVIAPTRYFCLPFAACAQARAGYASLYQAAAGLDLPRPGSGPLPLRPAPLDGAAVAARIDKELGFEWVAGVAARLLDGPVALVNAGALPLARRLDCLDAIAALLPYGFRAGLTASTWADSGSLHRIRLTFSKRARAEQQSMAWGNAAPPGLGDALGSDYLALLERLRDRRGTVALVDYLAADGTPRSFDEPNAALERLQALDRPYALSRRVRAGTADPQEVRQLFSGGDHAGLTAAEQAEMLRYLAGLADPGDIPILRRHWTPELLPSLVDVARPLLSADGQAFRQYMSIAVDHDLVEPLLEGLLAGEQAGRRQATPTQRAAIRLLRAEGIPRPGTWTSLRSRLVERPHLAYELLAQEIELGGTGRLPALLEWLEDDEVARRALRPFHLAVVSHTDQAPLTAAEIAAVAEAEQRYVIALAEAARSFHRTGGILPALTAWAARAADEPPAEVIDQWQRALARLTPADVAEQARIDLLRLLLGSEPAYPPRQMLLDQGEPAAGAYLEAFAEARGSSELRAAGPRLVRRLAGYVDSQPWTQPAALAENVLSLLRIAAEGELPAAVEPAAAVVTSGLSGNPELIHLRQYDQWWRPMVRRFPGLAARSRAVELRQELRRATSPDQAAALCATALRDGADQAALLAALRGCPDLLTEQRLDDLLRELLRRLLVQDASGGLAWPVYFDMVGAVLDGELGWQVAGSYRAWLASRAPHEIQRWVRLLQLVKDAVAEQDLPVLAKAEQLLHDARPSGRRWRRKA